MAEQGNAVSTQYRIGAVSRLTGISPDALRIWERRYAAVSPQRSPSGGRLYDTEDVARLRLLKQLVDAGDAIGEVANLNVSTLQERMAEAQRSLSAVPAVGDGSPCRVLVVGESLGRTVEAASDSLTSLSLLARYTDIGEFESRVKALEPDVLVIELPTLHVDTLNHISDWLARAGAGHLVFAYRYAAADVLQRLPAAQCSALRAPLDARTLQAHCLSLGPAAVAAPAEQSGVLVTPAPPRRYDDQTLARLATLSSAVKCECPRHLAELITSLSGFERYSAECESRNPRDAMLHAFLYATASQARHMIEDALDNVIEIENIKV